MAELMEQIRERRERVAQIRSELGPPTDAERAESRVQSVYSSLAIEDPTVTENEVRGTLLANS